VQKHEFIIDGEPLESSAEKQGEFYQVQVGQRSYQVRPLASGLFSVIIDGHKRTAAAATANGVTWVDIDSVIFELRQPSDENIAGGPGDHAEEKDKIFAPMPGKVVKLMVEPGDQVKPKQPVVIVEAMKMENPVVARAKGKVKAIHFAAGDQVDTESPIVELELEE
jgi:biotin carboxyl carrier protein